ncbi:MAG: hypothetical protein OEV20_10085, partial [Actinomycetota bacterium]|nr:hypothetical protein [Actinomycetota bacterium]
MKPTARRPLSRLARAAFAVLVGVGLAGCAGSFDPRPLDQVALLERAQHQEKSGIVVTVAVPSRSEARKLFTQDLYANGVQPIWIEIENRRGDSVLYLPVGT